MWFRSHDACITNSNYNQRFKINVYHATKALEPPSTDFFNEALYGNITSQFYRTLISIYGFVDMNQLPNEDNEGEKEVGMRN